MDLSLKCQSDWIWKLIENKGEELDERAGLCVSGSPLPCTEH